MKKKLILCFVFILLITRKEARCDNIIISGETLWTIFFSPFDTYPDIVQLREKLKDYATTCTEDNCIFLSTWKIVNHHLMLAKIENCQCNEKQQSANLRRLFGDRLQKGMLFADWFSGEIWVTKDRPNSWGGMFAASWPRETRLIVKNGLVISVRNFVYPKPVETVYQNTDSLNNFIYTHINWNKLHNIPQHSNGAYFRVDQNVNGYLTNLTQVQYGTSKETFNKEEMDEINRVAGLIQWPIYYYHGRPVNNSRGIIIVLSKEIQNRFAKRN